jgi:hypothetical protein
MTITDFTLADHGSICILHAHTVEAQAWADEFLPEDRITWGQNGTVIEPRYAAHIVAMAECSDLIVEVH